MKKYPTQNLVYIGLRSIQELRLLIMLQPLIMTIIIIKLT